MIKYCRSEHADLAVDHGRIRIGTIHGYQRIENRFLKDSTEGTSPYIISAGDKELILTNAESNAALQSPKFQLINDWKLALPAGTRTRLVPSSFNTFVYSMSVGDEPNDAVMNKLGYDSYYRILDADKFALRVAECLRASFDIDLEFRYARADCVYVDEKGVVITESNRHQLKPVDRVVNISDIFTKERDRYGEEQEHRIVWFLHRGGGDYSSIHGLEHLDIECPDIIEVVSR